MLPRLRDSAITGRFCDPQRVRGKKGAGSSPARNMNFKKLKVDTVALMADLVRREAADRDNALAAALRRMVVLPDGHHGTDRQDLRLTLALGGGLETAIELRCLRSDASLSTIVEEVGDLVDLAEQIFDGRHDTIGMMKEVRTALSREISKARRRGMPYKTLDVSLTPAETNTDYRPAVMIGVEAIGPLLSLERFEFTVESVDDVVRSFSEIREKQEQRREMRDHLASIGADVAFDPVTLAALQDAGISPAKAIADLRADDLGFVEIEARHGPLVLSVEKGIVSGEVLLGGGMHWKGGKLIVPRAFGISFENATGKPLSQLVNHSYLADPALISRTRKVGDDEWVFVQVQPIAVCLNEQRQAA